MDIENLLKDTFTEHEHVAADPERVLAATRQLIDRRRAVLSRPIAVAAGVVVLTLAAVTVVALNRASDDIQVAAPGGESQASSTAPVPGVPELTMPFDLGWLPPGDVDYVARRINIGGSADLNKPLYGGEYMITVTAGGQVIDIDVQHMGGMTPDDASFKSGPGNPVTINGQPGVESANPDHPAGYELYVTHPGGGSMYVGVSADAAHGSTASAQQLVDIGHQVAQNIRFPGASTVAPAFGLGELPSGLRMCAFDVERGFEASATQTSNTSYQLGTCDVMPTININIAASGKSEGTPGDPVQGHATSHVDENGYLRLFVADAVDGAPVVVAGKVPLTELYDIANRLVLPN